MCLEKKAVIQMTRYEVKKVFSKTGGRIAIVLLFFTTIIVSAFAVGSVDFVNADGISISGPKAARKLREVKAEWTGYLTDDVFAEVIRQNAAVEATPEAQSKDPRELNKAYALKQGYLDIRNIINSALSPFREYNYYRIDQIAPEEAGHIYEGRVASLTDWLNSDEAKDYYTEHQKQFFLDQYHKLEIPLYYEAADGWNALIEYSQTIIMIMMLFLSFLVCGIFTGEYQLKADAVFFSSAQGRKQGVKSKIIAGLLIITALYWALILLYTAIVLVALGTNGWNVLIQTTLYGWKSLYNITWLENYLLIVFGGYIGTLFILIAELLLSVVTRSALAAISMPFILLFVPSFIGNLRTASGILGLLPDQLLQVGVAVRLFNAYEIGDAVIGALPILFILYAALSVVIIPMLYVIYRKAEVY